MLFCLQLIVYCQYNIMNTYYWKGVFLLAQKIKTKHCLDTKYQSKKKQAIIFFIISTFLFLIFPFTLGLSLMPSFICFVFFIINLFKIYQLKKQIDMKSVMNDILSELPEESYFINDVEFNINNEMIRIDYLLINQNGIFVIEEENEVGYIEGNIEDDFWIEHKIDEQGFKYSKTLSNPISQLENKISKFKEYLMIDNIEDEIHGLIIFSNPNTNILLENSDNKIPILINNENIIEEILNYIGNFNKVRLNNQNEIIETIQRKI